MKPAPTKPPEPAALQVVTYPAPILKKRADDVASFDAWLGAVAERMIHLMIEHKGVGLAAPQVGLPLRLFIMCPTGKPEDARVVINPVLSDEAGHDEMEEGCLSLPDIRAKIVRYTRLHLEAVDLQGRPVALDLDEYPARIVQHENDHLDGILILDRMSPMAKLANRKKIKALEAARKTKP